jgi:hypothetical protein
MQKVLTTLGSILEIASKHYFNFGYANSESDGEETNMTQDTITYSIIATLNLCKVNLNYVLKQTNKELKQTILEKGKII